MYSIFAIKISFSVKHFFDNTNTYQLVVLSNFAKHNQENEETQLFVIRNSYSHAF